MKFGTVDRPEQISHTLPEDHPGTESVLQRSNKNDVLKIYVGLPNWNRTKLKGFYPRGTKDELSYYATQFNAIELNAVQRSNPEMQKRHFIGFSQRNNFRIGMIKRLKTLSFFQSFIKKLVTGSD